MMKIKYTLEQCREDHRRIWDWLRKNPTKDKDDFLKTLEGDDFNHFDDLDNMCALCEYAEQECRYTCDACHHCAIGKQHGSCYDQGSIFSKWDEEKDLKKKAYYATEILKAGLTQKEIE